MCLAFSRRPLTLILQSYNLSNTKGDRLQLISLLKPLIDYYLQVNG